MNLKYAVASVLLMSTLAVPAFAQGETADKAYGSGVMTFTTPSGTIVRKSVPPAMMAEMTKGAMPMSAGVMMMMQSLAQECAPDRIRINSIAPGAIRTPINHDAWATQEAYDKLMAKPKFLLKIEALSN